MAEKFYPTRHTTLGSIMDAGLAIHAFCFECGFDQEIDLERVSGELGRRQSALPVYLVPKLHCPQCGSKNIGTMLVTEGSEVRSEQIEHLKGHQNDSREGEPPPTVYDLYFSFRSTCTWGKKAAG